MDEIDVKIIYGGTRPKIGVKKDEKKMIKNLTNRNFLPQNLTRCKFFDSKSDETKRLYIKIWRFLKFSI